MFQRDTILKNLRSNVLEVSFTKVNGEDRQMRCTLLPRLLPESYRIDPTEQEGEKDFHQKNPEVIACWDVVKGGWRSFRIDSIIYIQVHDSY